MNIDENYYKQIAIIKKNIENKNFEVAIDKLFELMDIYGKQENILFELGKTYFFCNKLSEAEKIFIDILKYKNKYSYIFLAKILKYKNNINDLEQAILYLKQAQKLFNNDVEIILELIECYLALNNKKEVDALMKVVDIKEVSSNRHLASMLIGLLRKVGLVNYSIKLAESILEKDDNIKIKKELANDYISINKYKEAKIILNKLYKEDSRNIEILNAFVDLYKKQNDVKKLSLMVNKIIKIYGNNINLELSLIDVFLFNNLHKQAERKLKILLKKYPEEELRLKKILQGIYRKNNENKKLIYINLSLLEFLKKDEKILKETIELSCQTKDFYKAFQCLFKFKEFYDYSFFNNLKTILYFKTLEYIHNENIINHKKVVCKLVDKLFNVVSEKEIKIRNALLNEKEIAENKILLLSKPRKLQVVLTNKCNLRCSMCDFNEYPWEFNEKQIKELKNLIPYLDYLIWQGGEVFLSKAFMDLFELASNNNIKQAIITNGLLINDSIADKIVKNNVCLTISIDDVEKYGYEQIRIGGNFDKLISNLKLLNSLKNKYKNSHFDMKMSVVVMKSNYNKLEQILNFAKQYNFSVIELNPISLKKDNYEQQIFFPKSDYAKIKYINKILPNIYKRACELGIKINSSLPTLESEINKNKNKNKTLSNYYLLNKNKYRYVYDQKKVMKTYLKMDSFSKKSKFNKKHKNFCFAPYQSLMIDLNGYISPSCVCPMFCADTISRESIDSVWNSKTMLFYRKVVQSDMYSNICYKCSLGDISDDKKLL